jgi:uncharacterized protein
VVGAVEPDCSVALSRELSPRQRQLVTEADTFFITTADRAGNADASHRGGSQGFVQVLSPTLLRWPDYVGNAMFNTRGNLEVNPAAGLLFPDWRTGATLQLTGTARTDWEPSHAAAVPGAQRLVEFSVTDVVEIPGASPLRRGSPELSRFNPPVAPSDWVIAPEKIERRAPPPTSCGRCAWSIASPACSYEHSVAQFVELS